MQNSTDLNAVLVSQHAEATDLLDKIRDLIESVDPETAHWGHAADLGRIVECLRNAAGEV